MSSVIAPVIKRSRLVICLAVVAAVLAPSSAFAAFGDRTLKQGSRGNDVRVLQTYLTRAGFATPSVGMFGPQTNRNVKRFQRAEGLTANGVVSPAVAQRLRAAAGERRASGAQRATRSTGRLGRRVLKKGMSGQDVRVLQDYLTRAGFETPIDGSFGPTTLTSVKRFQRAQELTVDGVVGAKVVSVLRRIGDGLEATNPAGRVGAAGAAPDVGEVEAPVGKAKLLANGLAVAPSDAPPEVKAIIAAGNEIATKPYVYGGGHRRWVDRGYDCSGSVSYALHGGDLLDSPMPSGSFMNWGASGPGRWVTIYAHGGHMYMVVAGLRFDTSGANPSRWQTNMRSSSGFKVRHPVGF